MHHDSAHSPRATHRTESQDRTLAIEDFFRDAGFPRDLFRTLLIGSKAVDAVIEHPKVAAVTLTGSTAAGAAVAAKAGSQIKKTVLELGGSDPYLILEDASVPLLRSHRHPTPTRPCLP